MTLSEANRLSEESSLYLRQHAENPVHWQPWDSAALDSARAEQRPILLSIGYSACHWCHVMAHESFEDAETAEAMNRFFVNIKVDREERPDLDRIYQLAHQLLTGRGGGWPLTVFLDPEDLVPFFAGTYFPRERRYGMPAFREVLEAIAGWFGENRDELRGQNEKLSAALQSIQKGSAGERVGGATPRELLQRGGEEALARHDPEHGGFGGAPRFPQGPLLEAVAVLTAGNPETDLARALRSTLRKMALSGLRDHLDGGFFRYCVDATWTIPHFEKMLYDNAMLLPLYAEAAQRWSDPSLREAAEGIADWLQASMHGEKGGYAASIDADADGEEGGFHVWREQEVAELLENETLALFRRAYGLDHAPNFEGRAWHLKREVGTDALEQEFGVPADRVDALLAEARALLRRHRETRVHPTLDDKRLTSWNALLADGFVRAGRALGRDDWLDRADEIFAFIRRDLWTGERLMAVFNDGEARFHAYLDDYAWLLRALLDALAARWNRDWLDFAIATADALLGRFEDAAAGGFWFSDVEVEVPIARSMIFQDDATPAGNGIAAYALLRLARLLGDTRYSDAAERSLRRALPLLEQSPLAHASVLLALQEAESPPAQLVLAGNDPNELREWKRWAETNYRLDCYLLDSAMEGESHELLPGILSGFHTDRPATGWLCMGMRCLPPVHGREALESLVSQNLD